MDNYMEELMQQLTINFNPMRSAIGRAILIANITEAIITDKCEYSTWNVYYGICHAMHLLSETPTDAAMFKELRSYFLYKHRGMEDVMYTGKGGKINKTPTHWPLWQD